MANNKTIGKIFLEELKNEAVSTRKCLERIQLDKLYDWKPHPRSMQMGYLSTHIAGIPDWITHIITKGDIDLDTYERVEIKTTEEMLRHFDKNIKNATDALETVSDEELEKTFALKNKSEVLFSSSKRQIIGSTINHLLHHRGQLSVYMRLNDIPVPSIYGPSADEKMLNNV